jgi:putative transposase
MKSSAAAKTDTNQAVHKSSAVSMHEIATIMRSSRVTILRRSEREDWAFQEVAVRGGQKKLFPIQSLPEDVRLKIRVHLGEIPADLAECTPLDLDKEKIDRCSRAWDSAREWQKSLARGRLEIVRAVNGFIEDFDGNTDQAVCKFAELYRSRQAPRVDPSIYSVIESAKRSALYDWRKRFADQGIAGLISNNGYAYGSCKVPMDQQAYILGTFKANPNLKAPRIASLLKAKFAKAVGARAVRDFLRQKREQDPAVFEFIESPDSYKNKFQLALGSASDKAKHFLHYVEVDSTPADVLCADGKRHTIVGLVDVFSRKAKFLVAKTSNSWAIAGLLRETIRDWGVPVNLVRDNGQDYDSNLVNEILQHTLGVNVTNVPPFTPDAKPHIERAFRTLSHGLLETLPGYCGHDVAERSKIRSRKSFGDRLMKKGASEATGPTPQELQEAIDRWTEGVYHQRDHGELGMSPNVKAASVPVRSRRIEDLRSLDILLAPAPKDSIRIIGKKGLRLDNQYYWDDLMIVWVGRKVLVRLDLRDAGRVFLFDPETKAFICEALDMSISGITVGDLIAAKKRANKQVRERVKAIKTLAMDSYSVLEAEISNARRDRATVTNLQVGEPLDNPFVDAANAAAKANDPTPTLPASREGVRELPPVYGGTEGGIFDWEGQPALTLPTPVGEDNVVKFGRREQEQVERMYWKTPRQRFLWLQSEKNWREITEEEMIWLRTNVDEWMIEVRMFGNGWPREEQDWVYQISPSHFPQFAQEECK